MTMFSADREGPSRPTGGRSIVPEPRCSVSQVGDREWWCSTHRRDAEECDDDRAPSTAPDGLHITTGEAPDAT